MEARSAILHVGWPKTATTTLQHQLRQAWPNLAGRPWDRPGGADSRRLLRELTHTGSVSGHELDGLLESSWRVRQLPVVLSDEGLIGIRPWQHDRSKLAPTSIPAVVATTRWPLSVLVTLRSPRSLVASNYRYAVRGGYERSYAEFLTAEHEALARGDSPFAIRSVIESWEAVVGVGAVTVLWMEELVADPVASWNRLAAEIGVPALAAVGRVPMEHRNPTALGPLSWELRLNRILRSRSDRRRAGLTHRMRRFHSRHLGPRLHRFARDELVGGEQERSLLAAMDADVAWVRARFPTGSQDVSHPDEA